MHAQTERQTDRWMDRLCFKTDIPFILKKKVGIIHKRQLYLPGHIYQIIESLNRAFLYFGLKSKSSIENIWFTYSSFTNVHCGAMITVSVYATNISVPTV